MVHNYTWWAQKAKEWVYVIAGGSTSWLEVRWAHIATTTAALGLLLFFPGFRPLSHLTKYIPPTTVSHPRNTYDGGSSSSAHVASLNERLVSHLPWPKGIPPPLHTHTLYETTCTVYGCSMVLFLVVRRETLFPKAEHEISIGVNGRE